MLKVTIGANVKKKSPSYAKNEVITGTLVALLLGGGIGYSLGYIQFNQVDSNDAIVSEESTESVGHMTSLYEVDPQVAPKVELVVNEDPKSGYNIKIITTNFTFTPESVNEENVTGEGHAHLYLDGEKIARVYSPYYHFDGKFEGTKTFRVELNANDHSVYGVDGKPIEAEVQITHDSNSVEHNDAH